MDILRAWKDPLYRAFLSDSERDLLPDSPVATVELGESELATINGATVSYTPIPSITGIVNCWTIKETMCNGTCKAFGTKGCC